MYTSFLLIGGSLLGAVIGAAVGWLVGVVHSWRIKDAQERTEARLGWMFIESFFGALASAAAARSAYWFAPELPWVPVAVCGALLVVLLLPVGIAICDRRKGP